MLDGLTFDEVRTYAEKNCQFLGEGAYRRVYALDEKWVLKTCRGSCGGGCHCACVQEAGLYEKFAGLGAFAPVILWGDCWNIQARVSTLLGNVGGKMDDANKRCNLYTEVESMLALLTCSKIRVSDDHIWNIGLLDGRWVYTDYQTYYDVNATSYTPTFVRRWAGLVD